MEIYRADGWQGAIAGAEPGAIVNLAKHPLTNNVGYDAECSYSPDGKWIVFSSNQAGASGEGRAASDPTKAPTTAPSSQPSADLDLYVMRSDGSHVAQLTNSPGYDGGPFFSPDGKRIVYRSDRNANNLLQVFVADLVFDAAGNITGMTNEKRLTHDANVNWGPFWHPDGRHIIYATSMHGHANYELYLMRDDGSRKTRASRRTPARIFFQPSRPDGEYLMWTCRRSDNGKPQIFLARFRMPKGA